MKDNERFFIKKWCCSTEEDDVNNGCVGGECSYWDNSNNPIRQKDNSFKTIAEALAFICKHNGFTYHPEYWEYEDIDEDDRGRFGTVVTVDNDNSEADKHQIEKWKNGEIKLYCCNLDVWLGVKSERELTDDEIEEFNIDLKGM